MATVSECALNRTTSLVGTRTSKFSNWPIKRISSQILINFESQELEVVEFGVPSAWPFFAQIGHPVRFRTSQKGHMRKWHRSRNGIVRTVNGST